MLDPNRAEALDDAVEVIDGRGPSADARLHASTGVGVAEGEPAGPLAEATVDRHHGSDEEAPGTFDVRNSLFAIAGVEEFPPGIRREEQLPLHRAPVGPELPEEIDDLAIHVVDDFDRRWLLCQG